MQGINIPKLLVRSVQFGLLCILFLMASCARHHGPAPEGHFQVIPRYQRQAELAQMTHWQIKGAFSITQHAKRHSAHFTWNQLGNDEYRIRISSALDLYHVYLLGRHGSVTMWRSDRDFETAKSAERLMQQEMGWSLPMSNMRYWVRGLPAPGKHKAAYDHYGLLRSLQQQGWHIDYTRYRTVNGYDLPRRMEIQRPGMFVEIVIRYWTLFMHQEPIEEPLDYHH